MSEKIIKKFDDEMKDFKDRLEILESRMNRLEKIPQELKILNDTVTQVLDVYLTALDIDSCMRGFTSLSEVTSVKNVRAIIGMLLKNMKEFMEKYDKIPWKELVSGYMKRWLAAIYIIVSRKGIKFDDFSSVVIENLGSELAKKTIAIEDIVKSFGAKNATTWKKLIE